jgi:alginate O-acetyltransferase complex protein AlgI
LLFIEFRYLLFLFATLVTYWLAPTKLARNLTLLTASYLFYCFWDWRFLFLLLFSTGANFLLGRAIHFARSPRERKNWMRFAVGLNLAILAGFKYFDFFYASFRGLAGVFSTSVSFPLLEVLLPLGLSFYTFQVLSYCLDIYWKRAAPVDSLLEFSVFVAFFPQLLIGPIVRARDFIPQLSEDKRISAIPIRSLAFLFLFGYFKKAVIADNLSVLIGPYFENPAAFSALSGWKALFLNGIQLYCDFSGYSDMAVVPIWQWQALVSLESGFPPTFTSPFSPATFPSFSAAGTSLCLCG